VLAASDGRSLSFLSFPAVLDAPGQEQESPTDYRTTAPVEAGVKAIKFITAVSIMAHLAAAAAVFWRKPTR
jgi:hypothetical protein